MAMSESEAIEELRKVMDEEFQTEAQETAYLMAITALEELEQCRAIGTVSEFRELKEKATAKEPRFYAHNYYCTECGNLVGNNEFKWQRFEYCDKCGQKIDWSEGKE